MRLAFRLLPFTLAITLAAAPAFAECVPEGWTADELAALREGGFKLEDAARRDALAVALVDCLGDTDPVLRDGTAYEGLASWMRAKSLSPETMATLLGKLQPGLTDAGGDPAGVRQPFVALVMSEVARTDRVEPWLTPEQRASLVTDAAAYLAGVRDYRGFIDGEGWRHGVAHGSDLALQLAVNPAIERAQLDQLLAALRAQVVAADGHAYIHGEPGRLARAVFYIAQRKVHDAAFWKAWMADVAAPGPLGEWGKAFSSEEGLARVHDTRAFLHAMLALVDGTDDFKLRERLQPAVMEALAGVP